MPAILSNHPFPSESSKHSSLPKKKETQQHIRLSKMLKAVGLFTRKKTSRPFKDYYDEWIDGFKNTLLPLLRSSLSFSSPSLLSTHVEMLHHHFQSYYDALDLAASDDIAQLLYPDWRNSLEKPFLWLGDFHPYLFTNLLRSFLDDDDDDNEEEEDEDDDSDLENGRKFESFDTPWPITMAWKNPSETLMYRIDQIECGLRLMVPSLTTRAKNAQAGFIDRVAADWERCEGRKDGAKTAIGEAVMAEMEEMASVFVDANRLRRSVLAEIMGITNVYQAALFLEGLAQFIVGFRDSDFLCEFERLKMPLN